MTRRHLPRRARTSRINRFRAVPSASWIPHPLNAIIQDIGLGKDADGKVRYVASFVLTKPVDMTKASGMMWHDVPNRGRPSPSTSIERNFGDIGLASAWQGDNATMTPQRHRGARDDERAAAATG